MSDYYAESLKVFVAAVVVNKDVKALGSVCKVLDICMCEEAKNDSVIPLTGYFSGQKIEQISINNLNNGLLVGLFDYKESATKYKTTSIEKVIDYLKQDYLNCYLSVNISSKYGSILFNKITDPGKIKFLDDEFQDYGCCLEIYNNNLLTSISDNTFENKIDNIEEKYQLLKKKIYGQDEQLKIILSCIRKNCDLANSSFSNEMIASLKSNILLVGQTGVGKSLLIKSIAKTYDIPYVIEDATRYTASGWSGEDVENMIRDLYVASDNDLEKAEKGIIVIDEFDKLCNQNEKSDISTTAVQQSLLKILEGTKISISKNNHTRIGGFTFDTSKLTIVLAGAFDGIEKIIEKRCNKKAIGFNTDQSVEVIDRIQEEDLINYGIIGEFAGRISNTVELSTPTMDDLKQQFITSESSSLYNLKEYLDNLGITVEIDDDFINKVVEKSFKLKTNYRGLNKILNSVVEKQLFDIYSGKQKVLSLTSSKVE